MHPVIMQQLAAEHIREIHARAENARLARRARRGRRRAPSMRLPVSGTLGYDPPAVLLEPGGPRLHEPSSAPPVPVMAGSLPDSGDATTRRETLDHSR